MVNIGLIADTHGFWDTNIESHFKEADEIWHAGDIGNLLLEEIFSKQKVRAVYGNIDGHEIRQQYPEYDFIEIEGLKVLTIHIAGKAGSYNATTRQLIKEFQPGLLVCGHSHICKVMPDSKNKLIYCNPGAAGRAGFHKIRTIIRLQIAQGKITNMEVVELGSRGR